MRIHIKFSPTKQFIPYNYQENLVSYFHQCLGKNELHDETSLYSFSWLQGGSGKVKGLQFSQGANWFISTHDGTIIKKILQYVQKNPEWYFGMYVTEVMLEETPQFFSKEQYFRLGSPIFIKRNIDNKIKFFFYNNVEANDLLTETLQFKLKKAGLSYENVSVRFDDTYPQAATKAVNYKGITNKASYCPIIVQGTSEQIAFAWNVGVGNSTGIGFGALI